MEQRQSESRARIGTETTRQIYQGIIEFTHHSVPRSERVSLFRKAETVHQPKASRRWWCCTHATVHVFAELLLCDLAVCSRL